MTLTDRQWAIIAPHGLGGECDLGRTGSDPRLFFEAVLWIVRTGCPWRDLPDAFYRIFTALAEDADLEYAMVDGSIVKVHRHGQAAEGGLTAKPSGSRAAG